MQNLTQLKLRVKIARILLRDLVRLRYFRFSKAFTVLPAFEHSIALEQVIMPGTTFENKCFNIDLAAKRVSSHLIRPNEIFSFWRIVGNPNRDFKKSRAISNGVLKQESGGGLCQVSGIVYHLCLLAGLEVLERHNHSIDIYTEEERFTPLGTDATVVYGNKDFRIRNNHACPIWFLVQVEGDRLRATLFSAARLPVQQLSFVKNEDASSKTIEIYNETQEMIGLSRYKRLS